MAETIYMFDPSGVAIPIQVWEDSANFVTPTSGLALADLDVHGSFVSDDIRGIPVGQAYTFNGTNVCIAHLAESMGSKYPDDGYYWAIKTATGYEKLDPTHITWLTYQVVSSTFSTSNGVVRMTGRYGGLCYFTYDSSKDLPYTVEAANHWGPLGDILDSTSPDREDGPGGAGGPTETVDVVGGNGTQNNTSDEIETPVFGTDPEGPNFIKGAASTHLVSIYNPDLDQLQAFADWLWSKNVIDQLVVAFQNPIDNVIAFNLFPFDIPDSGPAKIKFGGVKAETVEMNYVETQFVTIDMGSLFIEEYWGNALDYSPYTKIQIYLPYIGFQDLDADEVMGKTIHLIYNVDLLSGDGVANIEVTGSNVQGTEISAPLYIFNGNMSSTIPLTATQRGDQILAIAAAAVNTIAPGAGGSLTAASNIPAAQQANKGSGGAATPPPTQQPQPSGAATASQASPAQQTQPNTGSKLAAIKQGLGGVPIPSAMSILSAKGGVVHSGNIQGNSGILASQYPYLVITRPVQALSVDHGKYLGYPANYLARLGELSGFTSVDSVRLSTTATEDEYNEIVTLLKSGVIL